MKKGQQRRRDTELAELIAVRLKELRQERGYTQEFVVERTRLNIPQYEARHYTPSLDSLAIICRLYGTTLDEFFATIKYPTAEK